MSAFVLLSAYVLAACMNNGYITRYMEHKTNDERESSSVGLGIVWYVGGCRFLLPRFESDKVVVRLFVYSHFYIIGCKAKEKKSSLILGSRILRWIRIIKGIDVQTHIHETKRRATTCVWWRHRFHLFFKTKSCRVVSCPVVSPSWSIESPSARPRPSRSWGSWGLRKYRSLR